MYCVYLLRSRRFPEKVYVGVTTDLSSRLDQHIAGLGTAYTTNFGPWKLVVAIQFENRLKAEAFEHYPKSGSGHSFARRHFGRKQNPSPPPPEFSQYREFVNLEIRMAKS